MTTSYSPYSDEWQEYAARRSAVYGALQNTEHYIKIYEIIRKTNDDMISDPAICTKLIELKQLKDALMRAQVYLISIEPEMVKKMYRE